MSRRSLADRCDPNVSRFEVTPRRTNPLGEKRIDDCLVTGILRIDFQAGNIRQVIPNPQEDRPAEQPDR